MTISFGWLRSSNRVGTSNSLGPISSYVNMTEFSAYLRAFRAKRRLIQLHLLSRADLHIYLHYFILDCIVNYICWLPLVILFTFCQGSRVGGIYACIQT
jgi:hypothetical protein